MTRQDILSCHDEARRSIRLENDRVWLHTIPREYVVDRRDGVTRPLNMPATRLEVRAHLVSASRVALDNIGACATRCGVKLAGIHLDTWAAGAAVLTPSERERGVVLVDLGGGTTDVGVWIDGALCHTMSIQVGGDEMTADIGLAFRLQREPAERLKRTAGSALPQRVDPHEMVALSGVPGRTGQHVTRRIIAQLLQTRTEEILRAVRSEVERMGLRGAVQGGYVLTGGVTSLPGTLELAEREFEAPVRQGIPGGVGGMIDLVKQPKFATVVGLLLCGAQHAETEPETGAPDPGTKANRMSAKMLRLFRRIL